MSATVKAPVPQSGSKSQQSRERFLSVWPRLRGELEDVMVNHKMPKDAQEWFRNVGAVPHCARDLWLIFRAES